MTLGSGAGLRRRIGHVDQVASVRPVRFADGPEDGLRALDVRTLDGLHALVLIDRGLDLGPAWYRGTPVAWSSGTGFTHPAYFDDNAWLRSFGGGLMVTCGLQNVGSPSTEDGGSYGLHGRISNTPARQVRWDVTSRPGGGLQVVVRGHVRESTVGGVDLTLRRTLRFAVGEPVIEVEDEVHNTGHEPAPMMILYHFNVGFPVVGDAAQVVTSADRVVPREGDHAAARALPDFARSGPPRRRSPSAVFEHQHERSQGSAGMAVVNEECGIGLGVLYRIEQLPRLWQWRSLAPGLYLIGIEPANCGLEGRAAERTAGRLDVLRPGARRRFRLRILSGSAQRVREAVTRTQVPVQTAAERTSRVRSLNG